jgi:hypothetical protein
MSKKEPPIHQDNLPAGEFITARIKFNEEISDFQYGVPQVKKWIKEYFEKYGDKN